MNTVWLPSSDESIAPVTILDSDGRVLRVVSAAEFRRDHTIVSAPLPAGSRHRRSQGIRRDERG